jgi:hypothetical protein
VSSDSPAEITPSPPEPAMPIIKSSLMYYQWTKYPAGRLTINCQIHNNFSKLKLPAGVGKSMCEAGLPKAGF